MGNKLPYMPYGDGIRKYVDTKFKGYNHTLYAQDGEIWDMKNLTSDHYPVLSPRRPRYLITTLTKPNGFYAHDGLYWVDGTGFHDGSQQTTLQFAVEDSRKTFVSLGAYIIILPDKKWYNILDHSNGSLESSVSEIACTIKDGTYAEEEAAANTIRRTASGFDFNDYFKIGDAVTISGANTHPENNTTIIIREIETNTIDGYSELRFYENSFVINEGGDSETLTISRNVPDMDFICENENRLWGCKGDTIYASKLGDPFNWNVFDGIATDSYAVNVGSTGDFTACTSYLGYPCFFKEEHIYKVYGDKPSNFQVMGSASLGVETGSDRSIAIAGEILFYLSRSGIVAYSGGIPQSIADAFGTDRYKNAVGGSTGLKYYVSMQDKNNNWTLFVYDTQNHLWHKEDGLHVLDFGRYEELYFLDSEGKIWLNGDTRTVPAGATSEGAVESIVEFGDFVEDNPNKKGTAKIQLRLELSANASITISMQFDSDGVWREVKTLTTTVKRSYYLPIIPRRSDHFRIKITGTGDWKLWSLVRENYSGSEL